MENLQFQESLNALNEFLTDWNINPLSFSEAKDWISGGESIDEIRELASELRSEYQSYKAECRASHKSN